MSGPTARGKGRITVDGNGAETDLQSGEAVLIDLQHQ